MLNKWLADWHWANSVTDPVMGTAALFTSAATFSIAVAAAPLFF